MSRKESTVDTYSLSSLDLDLSVLQISPCLVLMLPGEEGMISLLSLTVKVLRFFS